MTNSCASCFFSRPPLPGQDPTLLQCAFYPPRISSPSQVNVGWPLVSPTYWCGGGADEGTLVSFSIGVNSLPTALESSFGVWSAYTPTCAASTGLLTTVDNLYGRFTTVNKTLFFNVKVHITTNGTGSVSILIGIPGVVNNPGGHTLTILSGLVNQAGTNVGAIVWGSDGNPYVEVLNLDGSYPGGDNYGIFASGTVEIR